MVSNFKSPIRFDKDTFVKNANFDSNIREILSKYAQMTLDDYKHLSKLDKKYLRIASNRLPVEKFNGALTEKANVDDIINISKSIKSNLDKKYGKNKYVFCSIGKSPALFANVLEAMGVESKICRYSASNDKHQFYFGSAKYEKTYDYYKDYLDKMNLSADKISNSDKIYVFTDFVVSGYNLKSFQKIVEDSAIGFKLDNVKFEDMNLLVLDSAESKDTNWWKYVKYMDSSTLKKYAIIPADKSIPFIQQQYAHVSNAPAEDTIKLFRFALFDKSLNSSIT